MTSFRRIPAVTDIPHGWTLCGERLTVLATADIDVDAMPAHAPYSFFGAHRSEMAPGPARIAFAVTVSPNGALALRKRWKPGGGPLFASPEDWEDWALGGDAPEKRTSVAAPFAVAAAALAHAGVLKGEVPLATGTLDLIGTAHGARARAAAEATMAEASVTFEFLVGAGIAARLRRAAAAGWFPTPHALPHLLSPKRTPEDVDRTMLAARRWPFLREPLIRAFCTIRRPDEDVTAGGIPTLEDLATQALGKEATRAHLTRIASVGDRLREGDPAFLAGLPVDWLPAAPDDPAWDPLLRLASGVGAQIRHAGLPPALLLRDSKGRWPGYEARLVSAALPGAQDGTILGVSSHLNDMGMSFLRTLLGPAFAIAGRTGTEGRNGAMMTRTWGASIGSGFRLVLGTGALGALAERAGRFQRRRDGMRAALRATSPEAFEDLEWAAHLPAWTDPATGLHVIPLTDEAQLRAEGSAQPGSGGLSHCVGDYGWACASGGSRILSVRCGDGIASERLSTAELRWDGNNPPAVRQHNGRANGTPPSEARAAFKAYMATLSKTHLARPAAVSNRNQPPMETVQAGYDTTREENVALALDLWRPMLPRELRVGSLESFVAAARALETLLTRPREAPGRHGPDPDEPQGPRP